MRECWVISQPTEKGNRFQNGSESVMGIVKPTAFLLHSDDRHVYVDFEAYEMSY